MLDILIMMGTTFLVVQVLALVCWGLYLLKNDMRVMDVGWGLSFISAALVYFILGDGYVWRKFLILIIVSIWALRLIYYIINRMRLKQQDPRYLLLLTSWRDNAPLKINHVGLRVLSLFLLQGVIAALLSLPFVLMAQNTLPFFLPIEVFGLLIWGGAIVGEAIADQQLYQFKLKNCLGVYQEGLWRYSRHPNYFFEWVVWIGYFVMALGSHWGWLGIISPIMMLYLLMNVSGIPIAEADALRTRGEAYREYQKKTSAFFPWFRK